MSYATRLIVVGLVVFLSAFVAAASGEVEITSCGQVVTGNAFLGADLDCSGFTDFVVVPEFVGKVGDGSVPGPAAVISRKGRLDLRGHTIVAGEYGVFCGTSCKIVGGGGTVSGALVHGVFANKNLTISDATVRDNENTGLYVQGTVKAYGVVLTGNEYGIWIPRGAKLVSSTVTGNDEYGVAADNIVLIDSVATGNGNLDLVSERRPRLKRSTCETSRWGGTQDVCSTP